MSFVTICCLSPLRALPMPPTTLTTAPEDIVLRIFSFACTDDGQTGRSLVIVSKAVRALCRDTGIDIQCVAVCGRLNMEQFLHNLQGREERSRNVMSMFLSYRTSGRVQDQENQSEYILRFGPCIPLIQANNGRLYSTHAQHSRIALSEYPSHSLHRISGQEGSHADPSCTSLVPIAPRAEHQRVLAAKLPILPTLPYRSALEEAVHQGFWELRGAWRHRSGARPPLSSYHPFPNHRTSNLGSQVRPPSFSACILRNRDTI